MYDHINMFFLLCCYAAIIYGIVETDVTKRTIALVIGCVSIFVYPIITELMLNIFSRICKCKQNIETHSIRHTEVYKKKIPICYSKDYNITACGLEKCHPFDSCKYGRVYEQLNEKNIITKETIFEPDLPSRETLLEVMSSIYLLKLNYSLYLSKCVELPICFMPAEIMRYRLLNPMLKATQGTIEAACMALEHGWAINLSGGYHHATRSSGGGFCIYPDITFAVHHLRKWHFDLVKKIMIIDLDAHQGNGHERDFMDDQNVYIIDCYNSHIYPGDEYAESAIRTSIHVNHSHSDDDYLHLIDNSIKEAVENFQPDFIVYNAGTDCMHGDPLGNLSLTAMGILQRDEFIFSLAFLKRIPILMLLSGGYQKVNAPTIADSIENLISKLDLIKHNVIVH